MPKITVIGLAWRRAVRGGGAVLGLVKGWGWLFSTSQALISVQPC